MSKKLVWSAAVSGAAFFLVGLFLGSSFSGNTGVAREGEDSLELRLEGKFTNPLLECEVGEARIAASKDDFTPELQDFVEELKKTTDIANIAVYFRDLNNGPVIGVNQTETYAPASLLKVPVMIAYLRWAEEDPRVLQEKILYKEAFDTGYQQQFAPLVPLEIGTSYTAKELIENMIT